MTSYQDTLVLFALLCVIEISSVIYFTSLCFNNLLLRRYAYMLCNISLNTSIACSLVCFPGMTSSLAKVNKSSGAHFLALFLKFPIFLMILNIQIDLLILKTYYEQFTLTTKNHCISSLRGGGSCYCLVAAQVTRNIVDM